MTAPASRFPRLSRRVRSNDATFAAGRASTLAPAPRPLTLALRAALLGLALGSVAVPRIASAQTATAQANAHAYGIAAGPLEPALNQFARAAGINLSYDAAAVSGLATQGLSGSYGIEAGLRRLLDGTGLEAVPQAGSGYSLRKAVATAAAPAAAGPTLPAVEVRGQREPSAATEGSGSYGARAVTMFGKAPVARKDIPSSVSVLTRQQLDDQDIRTLQDALLYTPGLTSVNYGDGSAYFNARGFPVNVQYDGISLLNGIQYQSQFDLAMYDRLEVFRGPSGLMDGQGALGGSVNLVRKQPGDKFRFVSETSVGSWAALREMVDVTGPLNEAGTLRGRAVAVGSKSNSFVDGQGSKLGLAYGVIEYDLTPRTTVSLSAAYQVNPLDDFDYGVGVDTSGTPVTGPRGRSQNYGPGWNTSYQSMQEVNGTVTHRFDNDWKSQTTLYYRHALSRGTYAYAATPQAGTGLADYFGQGQRNTNEWLGFDSSVSGTVKLFGREHHLLFGANYSSLWQDSLNTYADLGTHDIFNPVIPAPDLSHFDDGTDTRTIQYGMYGQARLQVLEPLSLVLGGREVWFQQKTRAVLPAPGGDWSVAASEEHKFIPYAGLVYSITPQLSAYTSYAKIFSPQTQTTFSGGALPPFSGEQYEAGLKAAFLDGRLNASVAAFRINGSDLAVADQDHPTGSVASGAVRSQGWEAELAGTPLPNWNLSAGYTLLNTRYTSSPTLQGSAYDAEEPRHLFKLATSYRLSSGPLAGTFLGASMLAQSGTTRGYWAQGGYALFNARVGYRFNRHVEAFLALNNIADRHYYARVPNSFFGEFGAPRNVTATLRLTY